MENKQETYLENNHIDSLRHQLCDIIYNDVKGAIFSIDTMLHKKLNTLNKVYSFLKNHPEILQYKDDSKYWYPYENVNGDAHLQLYSEYYPNTSLNVTYFSKTADKKHSICEYLFDPVKLQFFIICENIRVMDCDSDTAKEIMKINNELFKVLLDTVGETISYNKLNTLEVMEKYIDNSINEENDIKTGNKYSESIKDLILDDYSRFNEKIPLLNETIVIYKLDNLQKELPINAEPKTPKKKI
jgi:hypothetical protein